MQFLSYKNYDASVQQPHVATVFKHQCFHYHVKKPALVHRRVRDHNKKIQTPASSHTNCQPCEWGLLQMPDDCYCMKCPQQGHQTPVELSKCVVLGNSSTSSSSPSSSSSFSPSSSSSSSFAVLRIVPKASCMLGQYCTTKLFLSPRYCSFFH